MNGEFGERDHEALLKRHAGLKWGEGGGKDVDDNNRRFGSIISVPRARPNSLTWPKLWPRNARDKRSKFLLSSVVVRRILSGFRHVVDASSIPPSPLPPFLPSRLFGKLLRPVLIDPSSRF